MRLEDSAVKQPPGRGPSSGLRHVCCDQEGGGDMQALPSPLSSLAPLPGVCLSVCSDGSWLAGPAANSAFPAGSSAQWLLTKRKLNVWSELSPASFPSNFHFLGGGMLTSATSCPRATQLVGLQSQHEALAGCTAFSGWGSKGSWARAGRAPSPPHICCCPLLPLGSWVWWGNCPQQADPFL